MCCRYPHIKLAQHVNISVQCGFVLLCKWSHPVGHTHIQLSSFSSFSRSFCLLAHLLSTCQHSSARLFVSLGNYYFPSNAQPLCYCFIQRLWNVPTQQSGVPQLPERRLRDGRTDKHLNRSWSHLPPASSFPIWWYLELLPDWRFLLLHSLKICYNALNV